MEGTVHVGVSVLGAGIDIDTPAADVLIGLRPLPDTVHQLQAQALFNRI
jgi:hypothetical protein